MFAIARRRLAIRYALVAGLVLGAFSVALLAGMVVLLRPDFDVGPEVATPPSDREANARELERIALAVVLADGVAVVLVGLAGYHLAGRTLGPIREAHERQGRFVADASHEIRTPLAVIRANVERALAAGDEAVRAEALAAVDRAAARLGAIASDLLVLARLDAGPGDPEPAVVDVSIAVAEAVEAARAARPGRAGEIRLSLEPDVLVHGDATDLTRLVTNLLDNALVHGGPPVDVATRTAGAHAVVEVRDAGPGIDPADQARIFEPFYRVRPAADAPEGAGLGLAIAARLAERLGASLSVRSARGAGTTFRLVAPRAR